MVSLRLYVFGVRLNLYNSVGRLILSPPHSNSVTRQGGVGSMGSTPVGGGLAPPPSQLHKGGCFSRLGFSSSFKSSEGLAPFVALDPAFCAPISTDVVRPQASKWADPKERHPSPAHEPRVGARQKRADLQENNVRSLARTRFEPISQRTGASPSFLRRLQRQPVSSLSFGSPFFEAERPFVGAHLARRHPAMGSGSV